MRHAAECPSLDPRPHYPCTCGVADELRAEVARRQRDPKVQQALADSVSGVKPA